MNRLVKLFLCSVAISGFACSKSEYNFETDDRTVDEKILETKISAINVPEDASPAERLLYLMRVDRAMKGMVLVMQQGVLDNSEILNKSVNIDLLKRTQEIALEEFDKEMPRLIKEMAVLYDKYYSEEELGVMVEFYKTDIGQKFIETTPDLMAASVPIGQEFELRLTERVTKRLSAELKENK